jgi:5-methylcytosine-specific restriction endonuclease McrA
VPSHAEIIVRAAKDLLEKRDPMKRAERAAERLKGVKSSKALEPGGACGHASADAVPGEVESHHGEVESCAGEDESRVERIESCAEEVHHPRKALPQSVKNAVWIRDEGQCTYVHGDGSRCASRMMLELDHILMVCRGGRNEAANVRLRCRYHNRHTAEESLRKILPRRFG